MSTQLGPLTYALTIGTASVTILPQNPSRKGLLFFNPSANTVSVCPSINNNLANQPAVLNGPGTIAILPAGVLQIPPAGFDTPGLGAAWNAIASSPGTAFTVWEF